MLPISGITNTIHTGTPQMKYYDKVIKLLRKDGITYSPDWEDIMMYMRRGDSTEDAAKDLIMQYDID